jgi:hypothetical protein
MSPYRTTQADWGSLQVIENTRASVLVLPFGTVVWVLHLIFVEVGSVELSSCGVGPKAVRKGKRLAHSGTAVSRKPQSNTVADLARFFPEATPVRIPVELTHSGSQTENAPVTSDREETTIEYGTAREVLFACSTRLEFGDRLRLCNSDGSLDTEASVVAVQYHPEKTIVAARFLKPVPNWIVKS